MDRGRAFFDEFWPEACAVADDDASLYAAFGLKRASLSELFGPEVFAAAYRAFRKGNGIGAPGRNPVLQAGAFVLRGREIAWTHKFRHVGDHPPFASLGALINAGKCCV